MPSFYEEFYAAGTGANGCAEDHDMAIALQLQEQINLDIVREREIEEEMNRLAALSMQEAEVRQIDKISQQLIDDRNFANQIHYEARPSYAERASKCVYSNGGGYHGDEVEMSFTNVGSLDIDLNAKDYNLQFPKERQRLWETYQNLGSNYGSITTATLLEEITKKLRAPVNGANQSIEMKVGAENGNNSSTLISGTELDIDPADIRHISENYRGNNKERFEKLSSIAARCFIYTNNAILRRHLLTKPIYSSRYGNNNEELCIDFHGLFAKEALQRLLPFLSICFQRKCRWCYLCVGHGNGSSNGKSKLMEVISHKLKREMSEKNFKERTVLDFLIEPGNKGVIKVKINLECPKLA